MRMYTASFKQVSISVVQDVLALYAGAMPFRVISVAFGQITQQSVANLPIRHRRIVATVTPGSGGTTPTPRRTATGDSSATVTAHANDTTQAVSSGTIEDLWPDIWNPINGYYWQAESRDGPAWVINPNEAWVLSLDSAPTQALTCSATVKFEEIR